MDRKTISGDNESFLLASLRSVARLKPLFVYLKNKYYAISVKYVFLSIKRAELVGKLIVARQAIKSTQEKIKQIKIDENRAYYKKKIKEDKEFIKKNQLEIKHIIADAKELNIKIKIVHKALDELWKIIKR